MNISDYGLPSNGNLSAALLDCPEYSDADFDFLDAFSFWVEGVLQTVLAVFGIIGNTIASVIISRKEMRNSFNLLLVSLACFDSTYLFGSILESFRKTFQLATNLHIVLFPHLLYPFNQVAISGSIFMTVAIAWERYIAVHYPLDYNQAMNDSNAMRKRLLKYVGPVFLLAFLFNLVKFFEATVSYKQVFDNSTGIPQIVGWEAQLEVAELRTNPTYSAYHNWSRLLMLGILPFLLLVFFNTKIYNDIIERRKRRMRINRNPRPSESNVMTEFVSISGVSEHFRGRSLAGLSPTLGDAQGMMGNDSNQPGDTPRRKKAKSQPKWRRRRSTRAGPKSAPPSATLAPHTTLREEDEELCSRPLEQQSLIEAHGGSGCIHPSAGPPSSSSQPHTPKTPSTLKICLHENGHRPLSRQNSVSSRRNSQHQQHQQHQFRTLETAFSFNGSSGDTTTTTKSAKSSKSSSNNNNGGGSSFSSVSSSISSSLHLPGDLCPMALDVDPPTGLSTSASAIMLGANTGDPSSSSRLHRRHVQTINERRRRFEDNLAAIFMGFVLVFLVCHFPRLLLNIHELVTIRGAMLCTEHDRQGFSMWSLILISISHFLLVLNSSINILIYCFLSSKFREECALLLRRISGRAGGGTEIRQVTAPMDTAAQRSPQSPSPDPVM